ASGRSLASGADHFGPPMAPSRMASAARQLLSVSSGSGSPWLSMATPPKSRASNVNSWPNRAATFSSARTPSRVTSGPMPSPARTVMLAFLQELQLGRKAGANRRPREWSVTQRLAPLLVRGDGCVLRQQVAELVHALHQAVAGEGLDGEGHGAAVRQLQRARLQV